MGVFEPLHRFHEPKLFANISKEIHRACNRAKNERRMSGFRQPVQQCLDQSRFAGSDFARQDDEAPARTDTIHQLGQAFLVAGAEIKKTRVRRDIERSLI